MDKKKFDEIMDQWVTHEMEVAPELEPNPDVYRKLEGKKKTPWFALFSWPVRLAAAGIAAALIILVIVMQPPKEMGPFVGLRKGAVAEKPGRGESRDMMQVLEEAETEEGAKAEEQAEDVGESGKAERAAKKVEAKTEGEAKAIERDEARARMEVAEKVQEPKVADKEAFAQPEETAAKPGVEEKLATKDVKTPVKKSQIAAAAPAAPSMRAQIMPEKVEFQYQLKGSESVEGLDIGPPQDEAISLTSEDNYRLILQLPQERHVYIFQVGADEQLIRLFPNTEYNPAQNPLRAGKTTIIPAPPDWLYVEKGTGEVLIYVVTSAVPLQDWDEDYAGYFQTQKTGERKKIAAGLLDRIEQEKQKNEDQISVKVFRFKLISNLGTGTELVDNSVPIPGLCPISQ